MKMSLIILFAFITAPLLSFSQDEKPMKFKKKAPEYIFLKKVEAALITHDADVMMTYIEPEYKRMQHDEFLAGRTLQFLTELFWCEGVRFNEITNAQLMRYAAQPDDKNKYEIRFMLQSNAVTCYCIVYMQRNSETGVFGLYGAMG